MDDKSCTKDNTNARLDLQLYCNRSELELIPQDDGTPIKPNASYVLTREQGALICQWLKELRFPDGYASNIARCVNMQELRLFGMKSPDCHVFMQRLLPIAFRDFLIDEVWGPLTEMSFLIIKYVPVYQRIKFKSNGNLNLFLGLRQCLTQLPTQLQQEQPTVTQPPLADDQFTGDDATMEEDTEECNLEVELDAVYVVLDPELDAQLEEELSRAVPKIGRGMDKGDDTLADPSQRKVLSLNHRGTFSHESWPKEKKRVAWENFQRTYYWEEDDARVYKVWRLHCRNRFRDEFHRARKVWVRDKKLPEFMHKDTFKILLAKWRSPKYIALQERGRQNRSKNNRVTHTTGCLSIGIHEDRLATKRGVRLTPLESYLLTHTTRRPDAPKDAPPAWICPQAEQTYNDAHQKYVEKHGPNKDSWAEWDPLIWKEVVGPPKKGKMRGMSTLQDPVEHGIPWRQYDMSDASSFTTRIFTTQVQQLQSELTQVREEMAERVQTEMTARIHTEVS
ncbi:hypothetical protein SLEP1_g18986 [Rubroshorea leprosula]|uniref:Transposase n=1 Tax=Rubroshorea leprosula TaxID=152421 RepID=A0AAV5IZB4_9ROSI|nr:hypothetical protein SLEP1_g18986 [Rubroshorea leprosula]